jgi:hypothetical protein
VTEVQVVSDGKRIFIGIIRLFYEDIATCEPM